MIYKLEDIKKIDEKSIQKRFRFLKYFNTVFHVAGNLFVAFPLGIWVFTLPYSTYRIIKNIQFMKHFDPQILVLQELIRIQKYGHFVKIILPITSIVNPFGALTTRFVITDLNLLQSKGIYLPTAPDEVASWPNRLYSDFQYLKLIDATEKYKKTAEQTIYLNTYKLSEISEKIMEYFIRKKKYKGDKQTDIYVSSYDLCKTCLIIGAMGTGKSVFIKNLLAQKQYNRAFIFDVKGEYLEQFYRPDKDILFNVYDERSLLWDMISDVKNNPALAQVIAEAITEQLSEQQRDFWITAATKLLKNAILYSVKENTGYQGIIDFINKYKENATKTDNKTELSIYITLEQVLDTFEFCAKLEQHYLETEQLDKFFRISDFVNFHNKNLYITASLLHAKAQMPLLNALVSATLATLLSKPDSRDYTFVLLDEFLSIKLPEGLEIQLFTTARSKALQLIIGLQYIPFDTKRERTKQLLLNSRYITVIFKTVEPKTLEIIENNFGEQEYVAMQSQLTQSTSEAFKPHYSSTSPVANVLLNIIQPKTKLSSASVSESTQRQLHKIITKSMIAFLPEYHCLTIVGDDMYLGKVEQFFYDMKHKPNPSFIPLLLDHENINIEEVDYE